MSRKKVLGLGDVDDVIIDFIKTYQGGHSCPPVDLASELTEKYDDLEFQTCVNRILELVAQGRLKQVGAGGFLELSS